MALNRESIHRGIIEGALSQNGIVTYIFTTTSRISDLLEEKNHSVKARASGLGLGFQNLKPGPRGGPE
jgi:hypothetical protein